LLLNRIIPISYLPPRKLFSNEPVDTGNPSPHTIPPAKKVPSGPGVAVNPQLEALLPENVEKTRVGSMMSTLLLL
jgi:hypothetical protein